jgi:FixJ family two-component response regulator
MLSREFPDLPVVIVTAHFNGEMMDRALKFGPMTILKKPASRQDLQGLLAMVRSLSGVGAQD